MLSPYPTISRMHIFFKLYFSWHRHETSKFNYVTNMGWQWDLAQFRLLKQHVAAVLDRTYVVEVETALSHSPLRSWISTSRTRPTRLSRSTVLTRLVVGLLHELESRLQEITDCVYTMIVSGLASFCEMCLQAQWRASSGVRDPYLKS